ncbi:MAG: hypothetical protein JKY31_02560 [Rhodobacteraceae bacterium]|nr:hypothetical protein [Paracoccaceae bacterium]
MKNIVLASILGLLTATASFAQDLCRANLSNEDLTGEYRISIGPGTMTVVTRKGDQRVHDAPLLMEGIATIAIYDGVPILYSDNLLGGVMQIALRPATNAENNLDFLDDPTIPTAGSEDVAFVSGCENATDLPQLIGTGTLTGNGIAIPNSVHLMVYLQDDGGISAIGVYDSTVISEAASGQIVLHVRFSISSF